MKKIAVMGSTGKMGQEILQVLKQKKISAAEFSEGKPANKKNLTGAEAIIDFTTAEAFDEILQLAVESKTPFVSGTTGISADQKRALSLASKKIPVLWAPNMSLGVALLKKAVETLAQLHGFDFQIEEFHHRHKKDRPSGTALALQETLQASLKKHGNKAALPAPLVGRAGGIVGIHKVYAASEEELLCFEHQALNRRVFAKGAVQAAEWLADKKPGLYHIEDLFND